MTIAPRLFFVAVATIIFCAGAHPGETFAGTGPTPNLRTGEWEVDITANMQGNGFRTGKAAEIAKMPPARRAKMQVMMSKMANRQVNHVIKSCLTPKDLGKMTLTTFFGENGPGCKSTVIAKSASRWERTNICSGDEPNTEHAVFQASDPQHVFGDSVAKLGDDGTRTLHMTAHWIGPTCNENDD